MQINLTPRTLDALSVDQILGDRVKRIASATRAAEAIAAVSADEFAAAKRETLAAVDRLEAQANNMLLTRKADEARAEGLLTWGGIAAMMLPAIALVLNLLHISGTWVTAALSGATLTGVLSFLFKPGEKLLSLARERQQLLVLPHAFRARIAAAGDFATLQQAAADLARALGGEPVQV